MNKYLTLFGLSWQKQLEVRSDFLFERIRSLSILFSLYFLWSALLVQGNQVLGYNREQLLTYVLMMTLLRAWVLGCVTDRIPSEIAKGKIIDVLLRPISYMGYWATQDVANKSINLLSAVLELTLFILCVSAPLFYPKDLVVWLGFGFSTLLAMVLYFQMSYMLGVLGFWTSQSWGPRFSFEVILEFCAGAYFPIDFLPLVAQKVLHLLPFPYLIFYPLSIYLERVPKEDIFQILLTQMVWIFILGLLTRYLWVKGIKRFSAEGR